MQLAQQRAGVTLAEAYRSALQFTGKVVVLVGVTLAAGVATWALSPIKFQADMGILLAFMFLWNMVGAVVLIPALSHFLLQQGRARPQLSPRPSRPEEATASDLTFPRRREIDIDPRAAVPRRSPAATRKASTRRERMAKHLRTVIVGAGGSRPRPGPSRRPLRSPGTMVTKADVSVPGREAVAARVEVALGGVAGWAHASGRRDQLRQLEGTATLMIAGQPPRQVSAGEGFVIPAGVVHNARNDARLGDQTRRRVRCREGEAPSHRRLRRRAPLALAR